METNCHNDREKFELKQILNKRIVKLRLFCLHALVYAMGVSVFILKEFFGVHFDFFPVIYLNFVVIIIWTSVFLFSAIDLIVSYTIFGKKWEERKVKSILEKKQQKQKWV
ncbi:2TM domain-containing protein [uncultured Flavobacterium sp.]|uniref:2TM domain-containing protein n=1 Tax=uncultured Flavobacterium sp. TaxID=165435 RepID=UPI00292D6DC9|nr:2TM domain-containing protein [uncultured Flavobacterium sp.]